MGRKVAQIASCLAPKIFDSTLATVRAALLDQPKEARSTTRSRIGKPSYEQLVDKCRFARSEVLVAWMKDVEKTVVESKELKGKLAPPCNAATFAIFCWVCNVIKVCSVPLPYSFPT